MEEESICPKRGNWFDVQANQWFFLPIWPSPPNIWLQVTSLVRRRSIEGPLSVSTIDSFRTELDYRQKAWSDRKEKLKKKGWAVKKGPLEFYKPIDWRAASVVVSREVWGWATSAATTHWEKVGLCQLQFVARCGPWNKDFWDSKAVLQVHKRVLTGIWLSF